MNVELVEAIDRYERVRGGVRIRELILGEMLLMMLLRRHGKMEHPAVALDTEE
jgi:hypothetical protein